MAVLEVTSREFRSKQRAMLDLADKGEQIIIRRRNKSYILTPIEEGDVETVLSPQLLQRIKKAQTERENGELLTLSENENLSEFIERVLCTE